MMQAKAARFHSFQCRRPCSASLTDRAGSCKARALDAGEFSGPFALAADWYRKALTELPEHNGDFDEDFRDDLRHSIASMEARLAETHAQPAEAGELSP